MIVREPDTLRHERRRKLVANQMEAFRSVEMGKPDERCPRGDDDVRMIRRILKMIRQSDYCFLPARILIKDLHWDIREPHRHFLRSLVTQVLRRLGQDDRVTAPDMFSYSLFDSVGLARTRRRRTIVNLSHLKLPKNLASSVSYKMRFETMFVSY